MVVWLLCILDVDITTGAIVIDKKVEITEALILSFTSSQKLPARIIRNLVDHDGRSSDDSMKPTLKRETDPVAPSRLFSVDDINLCTK